MSVRIIVGYEQGSTREVATLYDSVTGVPLETPIFAGDDPVGEAEHFLEGLPVDARAMTPDVLADYRRWKARAWWEARRGVGG